MKTLIWFKQEKYISPIYRAISLIIIKVEKIWCYLRGSSYIMGKYLIVFKCLYKLIIQQESEIYYQGV